MRYCLDCETEYADKLEACPSCGSIFFTEEPVSAMPKAKVEKGRRKDRPPVPAWPQGAAGEPVKPVLLETVLAANALEYDMRKALLHAFGIPTLETFPRDGSLGHIILGFSGAGLDIYVPETCLEEARTLLESEEA